VVGSRKLPKFLRAILPGVFLFGTFVGTCVAPGPGPEPPANEREPRAECYIRGRLGFWQRRLQLQDWTISIVMSHRGDLRDGTLGNIRWDVDKKKAVIRVLDAAEYNTSFDSMVRDMEFTVVHELIHLELASLPRSEASRSDEEHAVNRLADALLLAERRD